MMHPVGDEPPSVYWRRRLAVFTVVALAFLTMYAVLYRGGGKSTPAASASTTPSRTTTSPIPPKSSPSVTSVAATQPTSAPSITPAPPASPVACAVAALSISAGSNAKSYPAGATPVLSLQVTNKGALPCIEDLSDSKIELRVFSGGARVWGSHDCAVAPGTSLQTLPVGKVVRRTVQWSGLSSQPGCAGERQRVPAGTYTVTALLAGHAGTTATFTLN
jgi:hypothetical protein